LRFRLRAIEAANRLLSPQKGFISEEISVMKMNTAGYPHGVA
jgi:hypothetical protein